MQASAAHLAACYFPLDKLDAIREPTRKTRTNLARFLVVSSVGSSNIATSVNDGATNLVHVNDPSEVHNINVLAAETSLCLSC